MGILSVIGAVVGSVVPGIGTALGGAIGAGLDGGLKAISGKGKSRYVGGQSSGESKSTQLANLKSAATSKSVQLDDGGIMAAKAVGSPKKEEDPYVKDPWLLTKEWYEDMGGSGELDFTGKRVI